MSAVPILGKMVPYRNQTPRSRVFAHQARCDSDLRRRSFSGFDSPTTLHCSSESRTPEKQLDSLSSYFDKLNSKYSSKEITPSSEDQQHSGKELEILESYLQKLHQEPPLLTSDRTPVEDGSEDEAFVAVKESRTSYLNTKSKTGLNSMKTSQRQEHDDETSDLYLISILAALNIAVVLFELASPVRSPELPTVPLLYGAKVNHLIALGQWWRLVTPMFLHSGAFHVALSCWSLFTFGPRVCRGYGPLTFLLIYVLGGVSGNLISYLHTLDPTVGGTGPVYAVIGAWLMYQLRNKDAIAKDVSESLFQKAIIATGIGLILSHFCLIDEWSHFGSVFTGVAFGFLACPTLQTDDSGAMDEGMALVNRQAKPWKSLLVFSVFVLALASLFLVVEPPLNELVSESFL